MYQVELAAGKGVKIATILEDPVVDAAELQIYRTHTKHFAVRGSGFLSSLDTNKPPIIVIDALSSSQYKIQVGLFVFDATREGGSGTRRGKERSGCSFGQIEDSRHSFCVPGDRDEMGSQSRERMGTTPGSGV